MTGRKAIQAGLIGALLFLGLMYHDEGQRRGRSDRSPIAFAMALALTGLVLARKT